MVSLITAGVCASFGVILVVAGSLKIIHNQRFTAAVKSWKTGRPHVDKAVSRGLPVAEIALGMILLIAALISSWQFGALATTAVTFLAFFLVQVWLLQHRTLATCGCFGAATTVSAATAARPALFAVIGALAAFSAI